ncbi:Mannose/glucose-specific lectin [Bienertia sinuspersici]
MELQISPKQVIEPYGPYGSQFPENYHLQLEEGERITEVTIRHEAIVDAIGLTVAKKDGNTVYQQFGGNGGGPSKIVLSDGEYLTRISGAYAKSTYQEDELVVSTITIHTNLKPIGYGPFGKSNVNVKDVQKFTSPEQTDGPIVGVFGRCNKYVNSIGVLIQKQISPKQVIEPYGPYGSQFPENYHLQLEEGERITEVTIRHEAIVDAIGLAIAKKNGNTVYQQFGGNGGGPSKIVLSDGEYLTRISGAYAKSTYQEDELVVSTITIHTNLKPTGYGPFGKSNVNVEDVQKFTSPEQTDGPIDGIFGRNNKYVNSIGVLIRKEFPTST